MKVPRRHLEGRDEQTNFYREKNEQKKLDLIDSGPSVLTCTEVMLKVAHEKYGHIAILSDAVKEALASDFD